MVLVKDEIIKCKGICEVVFYKKCVVKIIFKNEKCEDCVFMFELFSFEDFNIRSILVEMNKKMDIMFNMEKKLSELMEFVDFIFEKYDKMCEF